jgi:hypothetical protein
MTQSAEYAGTVNRLELSGRLLSGFAAKTFQSGASNISATLACPSGRNGTSSFTVEIVIWLRDTNQGLIEHAATFKQGQAVVVSGKLNVRFSHGYTYVSCDITDGTVADLA